MSLEQTGRFGTAAALSKLVSDVQMRIIGPDIRNIRTESKGLSLIEGFELRCGRVSGPWFCIICGVQAQRPVSVLKIIHESHWMWMRSCALALESGSNGKSPRSQGRSRLIMDSGRTCDLKEHKKRIHVLIV